MENYVSGGKILLSIFALIIMHSQFCSINDKFSLRYKKNFVLIKKGQNYRGHYLQTNSDGTFHK